MEPLLVDARGVAALLGVGMSVARKLLRDGTLPVVRLPHAQRRVFTRASDVRRLAGEPEPRPEGDGSARPRAGARVLRAAVRPSLESTEPR